MRAHKRHPLLPFALTALLVGCGTHDAGSDQTDTGTSDDTGALADTNPDVTDCPAVEAPVCGVDGITYSNLCMLEVAGVDLAHAGACDTECTPEACGPEPDSQLCDGGVSPQVWCDDATGSCEWHVSCPVPGPAGFDVHEWGMVRFTSSTADLSTSGFGYYPGDIMAEKPLIYFHPDADFTGNVSVAVTIEGGTMREMWPDGGDVTDDGATYAWPPLQLQPGVPCGTDDVPTLDLYMPGEPYDGFCSRLTDGGVCETAELHAYLGDVPHCIAANDVQAPVLIYNAYTSPDQTCPVAIDADAETVTNVSDAPIGPVFAAQMLGPSERHIHRIDSLAPGETVELSGLPLPGREQVHDDVVLMVREALEDAGLTEGEATDFIEAWRPNVLSPYVDDDLTTPWAVLGFYDASTVDALYPLEITPEPRDVRRVLAFTLEHL